jgi:murein DD-endopeptidase MepM/ murein hydrolase activator NlpD
MVGMLGFGATAFGLAPLTATEAALPQRLVTERVVSLTSTRHQLDQLAEHDLQMLRNDVTRTSDTADSLLNRLNVTDAEAAAFLRTDMIARKVLSGRAGKMIQVRTNASGNLQELVARYPTDNPLQAGSHFTRLRIGRDALGFTTQLQMAPLVPQVRLGTATVQHSLFSATDEANIPDAVARQVAEIFANDIDFRQEVPRGARVSVVYETLTADDEPVAWRQVGRVLAAQFMHQGENYAALWFKDSTGKGGYFDLNGQSKRRSFLSSPLEVSRVTSGFAVRFHPILRTWAQHKGIDYAAPTGTPVRSVAEGTVDFAGWQNGYGNVVMLDHSNGRSTVYAHLSRIDVQVGQKLPQGYEVGAVGATGWATGPHLHFELKMDGVQQDPQSIASTSHESVVLDPTSKPRFDQAVRAAKSQLSIAQTVAIARFNE